MDVTRCRRIFLNNNALITAVFLFILCACQKVSLQDIRADVGFKAPRFELFNLQADKVALEDLLGEGGLLLSFGATWCPYCVREVPELNRIYDEYNTKLVVAYIDIQEDRQKVLDFITGRNIRYKVLLDTRGYAASSYKVLGIPTVFAVTKEGIIKYRGNDPEEALKSLIKEVRKDDEVIFVSGRHILDSRRMFLRACHGQSEKNSK